MTGFLVSAALLVAATLALLARPWWWRRASAAASRQTLNTRIYRDQMAELERDHVSGQLPAEDYAAARDELQRRLIDDVADEEPAVERHAARATLIALLVLVPAVAGGLYALFGNPAGLDATARRDFTRADVDKMVASLAAKLEQEPDNLQGWAMLARSYKAMRRPEDAKRAYDKAWALVETDAQLLSDYADLLASSNNGDLTGRPEELVNMALKIDPDNLQSLWLAGTAAFNRDDFRLAVTHWERAMRQLPADSDDARMLGSVIEEARQKLPAAGKAAKQGKPGK
jgi:cytochrome c-type biogenesis protein CcmH